MGLKYLKLIISESESPHKNQLPLFTPPTTTTNNACHYSDGLASSPLDTRPTGPAHRDTLMPVTPKHTGSPKHMCLAKAISKRGPVARTYNSSPGEVEAEDFESGVQSHPVLHRKAEISWSRHVRACLKEKEGRERKKEF